MFFHLFLGRAGKERVRQREISVLEKHINWLCPVLAPEQNRTCDSPTEPNQLGQTIRNFYLLPLKELVIIEHLLHPIKFSKLFYMLINLILTVTIYNRCFYHYPFLMNEEIEAWRSSLVVHDDIANKWSSQNLSLGHHAPELDFFYFIFLTATLF